MNASTTTIAPIPSTAGPTAGTYGRDFWEHLWRTAGLQSVGCFVGAYVAYGFQPAVATIFAGMAVLNLMWFGAAIRATLIDAGQDGWGAAATASSAALGAFLLLLISGQAALVHSIAAVEDQTLTSAFTDLTWAGVVMTSFPRAMLIMAASFGLWRGGLISSAQFATAVAVVVLVLAGGTTWMSDGFWSPSGAYSRVVSPIVGFAWIAAVTRVLLSRAPLSRAGW